MGVRIGIIGAGGMARYHIEGFRSAGAEVACITDVNPAAARRAAEAFGIPQTYASAAEMYRRVGRGLDGVSIIVPNRFHKPLAIAALKAGKHVFCEKPPALNAREVIAMRKASARARRLLVFDFNNRARPEAYALKAYIDQGAVGRIHSAQALWIRRTGIPGFGGWFTNRELSGGGPLIDLLHMIDLALYMMGYPEPEWVLGQTFDDFIRDKAFKGPWGIPDAARGVTNVESACHGLVRFKSGQVLFLRTSWAEMNRREEVSVTFQGERAGGLIRRRFGVDGLDETAEDACELYVQENGCSVNRAIVTPQDKTMGRVRAAANFVLAIEKKEAPLNTPAEAVALMKVIDAVYASAASGRPVRVK